MPKLFNNIFHFLLPSRIKPRKIWFGLAKGRLVNVDFRYDTAFVFGRHEPELYPHYKRLLRVGMNCFDIGMYRGWDALSLAHLTNGEVVSFDGNPVCLKLAAEFLAPSGLTTIRLVEAYLSDGSGGGTTLDQAAANYFMPDFIKIDVEGAEASVLKGGRRILTERRPSLIIETHGAEVEDECKAILKDVGYSPITVERLRGWFSEARSLEHNRWLVCEGRVDA
jgi:hypothetical protein